MKKLFTFLICLCSLSSFAGTRYVLSVTDPVDCAVATECYVTNYVALHAGGSASDWSTFAAVQDVDAAGHNLINFVNLNGANGFFTGSAQVGDMFIEEDGITSADGLSLLSLGNSANFGIHNGEPAGVGSDINLVSDNGAVNVDAALGFSVGTALNLGSASAVPVAGTDARANIGSLVFEGYWPSMKFNVFFDGSDQRYINDGPAYLFYQNFGDGTFGIEACPVGTSGDAVATFSRAITLLPDGKVLVGGAIADDGSGAPFQAPDISASTGGFWAQGSQGVSGSFTAGSGETITVAGGIIVNIIP